MIILDEDDAILTLWRYGTEAGISDPESFKNLPLDNPVAFRGMTKFRVVNECRISGRDFYYIDTGYLGNCGKRKNYHRVVKNDVQHTSPILVPSDRFEKILKVSTKSFYKKQWNKQGSNILLVTPSEKPCKFYGITRDRWVNNTLEKLKNHTDRKIIVTYNSIAATEAVSYGIPAFADAPINAAKSVCSNDFTKIEDPFYPDRSQVDKWLHWLAYCQYTTSELKDGTAYKIQEEFDLC
jgi:hypothetical protein